MRKLPFLNGVRAFEAAARTGSFIAAASELHVTASAVSRLVRLLEQRLGVVLFERKANRLVVTQAGQLYQAGLAQIFDNLANLTEQIATVARPRILTIGVGPTFATRWLIPRLAEFRRIEPDIDVRITTGGVAAPFADDWTCGVTLGNGDWPDLVAEPLFTADLLPVCAPALATRLRTPAQLKQATLLRVSHAADDWPRWLRAAGIAGVQARGPQFAYYGQALQAAVDGIGVAMGIRPYIDDDLSAGRLVAPFLQAVPKGKQWYLVYRAFRREEPAFLAFAQWIKAAAQPATQPLSGSASNGGHRLRKINRRG